MALADHLWREPARRNRTKDVDFRIVLPLGATGAIAAGASTPGVTITKVGAEAGRYLVQFIDSKGNAIVLPSVLSLCFGGVTVQTAAADAAYTAAKATSANVRNNTVSTTGSFQIQMIRTDTFADAETEDNAVLHISFSAKFSSVTP